jgi:hypothetical protein
MLVNNSYKTSSVSLPLHSSSNQQVQPRAQLGLSPYERTQETDAQDILQSLLHSLFTLIVLTRRSGRNGEGGIGRLPSTDGFEQVSADLGIRRSGTGGDFLYVSLDLSEIIGEGGYALLKGLERGKGSLSGVGVGGKEIDCKNTYDECVSERTERNFSNNGPLTTSLLGQLVLDGTRYRHENTVLGLGVGSDRLRNVGLDSQAGRSVILRKIGIESEVDGRSGDTGFSVEEVLDEGGVSGNFRRGRVPDIRPGEVSVYNVQHGARTELTIQR